LLASYQKLGERPGMDILPQSQKEPALLTPSPQCRVVRQGIPIV
jgi:hypothetical protein